MFTRIIFFISILSSLSIATSISIKNVYINGTFDLNIDYSRDRDKNIRDRSEDWVALYKKESSNAWKNVIQWKWVNNYTGNYNYIVKGIHIDEAGTYEIRFFKNNSFIVDKSFEISSGKTPLSLSIEGSFNDFIDISVFGYMKSLITGKRDWIGIYKKSDDNSWGNVIQWTWVSDIKKHMFQFSLDENLYKKDVEYEARYFLNNSFNTYVKSKPFKNVGELANPKKQTFSFAFIKKRDGKFFSRASVYSKYIRTSKDWIGIFKRNVGAFSRSKLIAWSYVDKAHNEEILSILKPELLVSGGEYKAILFTDNDYRQIGREFRFKAENW